MLLLLSRLLSTSSAVTSAQLRLCRNRRMAETKKSFRFMTSLSSSPPSSAVLVGLIIIGDEILSGSTQDVNTTFVATRLHSMGLRLQRVSIIPDEIDVIAEEIKLFSDKYDVVITSGGIGPTHDDKTFEGVAKAFDDKLEVNKVLEELVSKYFSGNPNASALKLATIPSKSKLHFGLEPETQEISKFPIVNLKNVFVFPGIPQLLRKAFISQGEKLFGQMSKERFYTKALFINDYETAIADQLKKVLESLDSSKLSLGSYPELEHSYYKVKIVIESNDENLVEKAEESLRSVLANVLVNFDPHPEHEAMDKIRSLLTHHKDENKAFVEAVQEAQASIAECFERFKPNEVFVCFNGGKDCIAMLHLVYAYFEHNVLNKWKKGGKESSAEPPRLHALYIRDSNPFDEVEKLVLRVFEADHVVSHIEDGPSMKEALRKYLDLNPHMKAAVMGTRRSDPHGHRLQHFAPTDGDWPRLMRALPILGLEYSHVWMLIRGLSLPYPSLYDRGFTSLGAAHDTLRNEALKYIDEEGKVHYRPAYMLDDHQLERAGRTASQAHTPSDQTN